MLSRSDPTFHPNTIAIAWAAGIYEGEGSCGCYLDHRRETSGLSVTVTQKDKWLLERLIELFGGKIYGAYSGSYRWIIYGQYAAGFLMTMYKFLSPRRQEQVKLALNKWKE